MTIRTIFVPIRGDGKGEGVLDHAIAFGQDSNAHIEVVHCRPRPEDVLPFGVFLTNAIKKQITSSASALADEEERKVKGLFDDYCSRHDLAVVDLPPWPQDKMSASWREITGKQAAAIAAQGRLSDVVVVPRPDRSQNIGFNSLEAALFETGKPVLMCPPAPAGAIGRHVAIAWSRSAEAARSVTMALPVLERASAITVLTVDTGDGAASGQELTDYLACHGLSADAKQLSASASGVGGALLDAARDAGADLLVMGAFGQNRRRELVLGGVTQHIIDTADLPILMAH
ncbi:MAG: universal stress protein [Hyphomicrobiales bacterium]